MFDSVRADTRRSDRVCMFRHTASVHVVMGRRTTTGWCANRGILSQLSQFHQPAIRLWRKCPPTKGTIPVADATWAEFRSGKRPPGEGTPSEDDDEAVDTVEVGGANIGGLGSSEKKEISGHVMPRDYFWSNSNSRAWSCCCRLLAPFFFFLSSRTSPSSLLSSSMSALLLLMMAFLPWDRSCRSQGSDID